MAKICYGGATHVGCVRERNEDNYLVDRELGLWLVADGMGGHDCGEVASRIVVDFIKDAVAKGVSLVEAVEQAHHVVVMAADQGLGLPGMGATLVALKLSQAGYELVWVGDSRAYLWDHGQLTQLTRDHSLVQQLLDAGQIDAEDALNHPYRNCVTQAVGATDLERVKPEKVEGTFCRGQQLLLCTDGLTGEVSDEEIRAVLSDGMTEQASVERLIEMALEHGGSDNVTAVLVSAPDDAPDKPREDTTIPLDAAKLVGSLPCK